MGPALVIFAHSGNSGERGLPKKRSIFWSPTKGPRFLLYLAAIDVLNGVFSEEEIHVFVVFQRIDKIGRCKQTIL